MRVIKSNIKCLLKEFVNTTRAKELKFSCWWIKLILQHLSLEDIINRYSPKNKSRRGSNRNRNSHICNKNSKSRLAKKSIKLLKR